MIIAGAGGAAHLPGMLAAKTLVPVLGVPVQSAALSGVDSLYSIVQMPRGIPVGTLAIGSRRRQRRAAGDANPGAARRRAGAAFGGLASGADRRRLEPPRSAGGRMKPVCVLGNGQLGRMLRQAGEPLGIAVYPVGIDAEPEAVPYQNSVITAEIERWPETALTRELATHSAFVNRDIFPRLADRLTQNSCSTSSAWRPRRGSCWRAPPNGRRYSLRWASWRSSNAGSAAMTAAANGACARQEAELPADAYGECIVEQGINFSGEVSLVARATTAVRYSTR